MHQAEQAQLLERIFRHVEQGATDIAPQPEPFSRRIYNTPARLAAERDALFRKLPLVVGFSSQLREPGDYISHDLSGVPLLVVRRADGQLGAFINSCRHRGAKVVSAASGRGCKRFVCPYHAWSYDLDGSLHGLPEKRCFPRLKMAESGLIGLPCAERHGLVFVVPTPGVPLDIDAYLGRFGGDFGSYGLERYSLRASRHMPGRIDWKLMVEANQESYHINFLHGRTAGRRYRDQCSLLDLATPHTRSVLVHASTERSAAPTDVASWRLLDHADLVYFIFPNTMLLWAGNGVQVISPFPQGLGHTVMQMARLDPPTATTPAAAEYSAAFFANYCETIAEDVRVSETIQFAANAPADVLLQLGGNELPLAEFHHNIERALRGELTTSPAPERPVDVASPCVAVGAN